MFIKPPGFFTRKVSASFGAPRNALCAGAGGPSGPVNTVAPAITGTAKIGSALTCSTGTWTGADTYARQWLRDGAEIAGQTGSTYVLQAADDNKAITCMVTATGVSGSTLLAATAVTATYNAPTSAGDLAAIMLTRGSATGAAISFAGQVSVSGDAGKAGVTYALAPGSAALPAGLSLSSGQIASGQTPSTITPQASVVVRASNSGGSVDVACPISVWPASTAAMWLASPAYLRQAINGTGAQPSANNDPVGYLIEQSGNGWHLAAPADASRLAYVTGGAVQKASAGPHLERGATPIAKNVGAITIVLAVELDAIPADNNLYLLSIANGTAAGTARASLRVNNGGGLTLGGRKNDADSFTAGPSITLNDGHLGAVHVVTATLNAATNQGSIQLDTGTPVTAAWSPGAGSVFANTDALNVWLLGLSGSATSAVTTRVRAASVVNAASADETRDWMLAAFAAAAPTSSGNFETAYLVGGEYAAPMDVAARVTPPGGQSITSYAVQSGDLMGRTLAAGVISGPPMKTGSTSLVIRATASGGGYVDVTCPMSVRMGLGANFGNPGDVTIVNDHRRWLGKLDYAELHCGYANSSDYTGSPGYVDGLYTGDSVTRHWSVGLCFSSGGTLAQAAAGSLNTQFASLADTIISRSPGTGPIWIRPGYEMDLGWTPWAAQGNEANYKNAFIQFSNTVRARTGGDRIKLIWCPNSGTTSYDASLTYPGDAYVDAVGVDFYVYIGNGSEGFWNDPSGAAAYYLSTSTSQWRSKMLRDFAVAHGKPWVVNEWGVHATGFHTYIDAVADFMAAQGCLFAGYWDNNAAYAGLIRNGALGTTSARYVERFGGHYVSLDFVNGVYQVGDKITTALATFLGWSEVHFASDPTAAITGGVYTPADAHDLYIDLPAGSAKTVYVETAARPANDSSYNQLIGFTRSTELTTYVEIDKDGFSDNLRSSIRNAGSTVGTDTNFGLHENGPDKASMSMSGTVVRYGLAGATARSESTTVFASKPVDRLLVGGRGGLWWKAGIRRVLVRNADDAESTLQGWTA